MPISFKKFHKHLSPDTISTINAILVQIDKSGSYPYYFSEYVLHGIEHIQHVLNYAEQLIPDETLERICEANSETIDVLVLAITLHDMAMFIDEYGFDTLIKDKRWDEAFNSFTTMLKKADDETLDKIYGAMNSVLSEEQNAKILSRRDNMFDKRNKYTVGEFLRRHHHEIAYDISVNGFPRKERRDDFLSQNKYKTLVGFIAKAHRGDLRKIMDDAESERIVYAAQGYSPHGIPLAYLMAVLWIADEIDDKAAYRVPLGDMLDKELTPFSAQQWQDNMCVIDTSIVADKALLFIQATPENTNQFLRVQAYSKKVQFAIDQSISAIIEFCGLDNGRFNLTVVRVKSSLDIDRDSYDFLPVDASLRISSGIVDLLIAPLYGKNPSCGVRELLSNALDACREREYVDESYSGKAMILCSLSLRKKQFKIIDNGIGMTADTIVNYFMTVGASLRNSYEWKLKHTDDKGYSTVPRLGRFGIGVLSAFLLGNKIEITTRHYDSPKGYRFSIAISGGIPDIAIVDCEVGTEIAIDVQPYMKTFQSGDGMMLFSNGDKYHYVIPHYPFTYPVCLYSVDYFAYSHDNIYYYDELSFLKDFDFDTVKIQIGSLLDTKRIVFNDSIAETYSLFHSLESSPCLPEGRVTYDHAEIFDNTKYYNQDKTIEYNYVSIEKIYYNGMLLQTVADDISYLFSGLDKIGLTVKPLYVKIEDNDNSASLNLQKTILYDGKALHKLREVSSFFLVMLPLVVGREYIEDTLKRYPIDDVVLREISYAVHKENNIRKQQSGSIVLEPYLSISRKKFSDFAFEYDPDTCIEEDGLLGYMSKAIIEWLVVSEGYQQDYKIPFDIQERRRKYTKAFVELDRYLQT